VSKALSAEERKKKKNKIRKLFFNQKGSKLTGNAIGKLNCNIKHNVMPVFASGHAEENQHGTRKALSEVISIVLF